MLSFTIGRSTITVFIDGHQNTVGDTHMNFAPLAAELRKPAEERDMDRIRKLVSVRKMLESKIIGHVGIMTDGTITYRDEPVNNYMTQRMIQILGEGYDITPWANFMNNVMENPATYAHSELYEWMEKADMPITEDGCFIAFKKVRRDYKDCHSGKFDNSVGTELVMSREACDPKRTNHCSTGFHFCSAGYLKSFNGERVMVLKINPRDVTSIPNDYQFTKGRTCRYVVIGELDSQSEAYKQAWQKGVVTFDDDQELPDVWFSQRPAPLTSLPQMQAPDERPVAKMKPQMQAVMNDPAGSKPAGSTTNVAKPAGGGTGTGKIVSFTTGDGRTFLVDELKIALIASEGNNRGAARGLGIGESTLRGWRKKANF